MLLKFIWDEFNFYFIFQYVTFDFTEKNILDLKHKNGTFTD